MDNYLYPLGYTTSDYQLRGKVKSFKITTYMGTVKNNTLDIDHRAMQSYSSESENYAVFDTFGYKIISGYMDDITDSYIMKRTYKYNSMNLISEIKVSNSIEYKIVFFYDIQTNSITEKENYSDFKVQMNENVNKVVWYLDNARKIIRKTGFKNGEENWSYFFYYDSNNRIIEIKQGYLNPLFSWVRIEYDENGNISKCYRNSDIEIYNYVFDSKGNWIRKYYHNNILENNEVWIEERIIEYY